MRRRHQRGPAAADRPALVNGMLIGLRRTRRARRPVSLGRRGSAEVDVDFFRSSPRRCARPDVDGHRAPLGPGSARGGASGRRPDGAASCDPCEALDPAQPAAVDPGGRRACRRWSNLAQRPSTSSPKSSSGTPPATASPPTTCPDGCGVGHIRRVEFTEPTYYGCEPATRLGEDDSETAAPVAPLPVAAHACMAARKHHAASSRRPRSLPGSAAGHPGLRLQGAAPCASRRAQPRAAAAAHRRGVDRVLDLDDRPAGLRPRRRTPSTRGTRSTAR